MGPLMPRRSPFEIHLSTPERTELERRAATYTAPYRDVIRAKIVLMAADGLQNKEIAHRLSLPVQIITKWRKRFYHERLPGLDERPRTGRPPQHVPHLNGA
jgi:transposase-like protein